MAALTGQRDKTKANSPIIKAMQPENMYTSLLASLLSEYDHKNCVHIRNETTPTINGVIYKGSRRENIILKRKNNTKIVMTKATILALLKRLIVLREEMANMFSVKNNEYAPNAKTIVKRSRVKSLAGISE